jgi:hypothetical protein
MTYDLLVAEDEGDEDHERNVKLTTGSVYLAAVETASYLIYCSAFAYTVKIDLLYCHGLHADDGTSP